MQTVLLIDNPLEPLTWERLTVPDVRDLLMERYAEWPAGARIYAGGIGEDHDVTPQTEEDVERLPTYPEVAVVVMPEHPALLLIIVLAVAVIATVAMMFLLPSIPTPNTQTSSANNSLAERTNQARPNARIPDIYGEVRSVPDLVAVGYRVYENHREVEIAYMCIGRGAYHLEDARDGDTLIADILGASIAVYGPYQSPNNYATPQLQIGTAISDPVFNVRRLNEVNGQVLAAPNSNAVQSSEDIKFKDGGIIEAAAGSGIDFTQYFTVGSTLTIGSAESTDLAADASAIFASATGIAPNTFRFASFNPSTHFQVGQQIVIDHAVFTWTDGTTSGGGGTGGTGGGGGGDISGSTENTSYPWNDGNGLVRPARE